MVRNEGPGAGPPAGFAASSIVGYLRDVNGYFKPSFILLAVVAVLMLSVTPFLHPHRRQT
jgi:hypothetical protein